MDIGKLLNQKFILRYLTFNILNSPSFVLFIYISLTALENLAETKSNKMLNKLKATK